MYIMHTFKFALMIMHSFLYWGTVESPITLIHCSASHIMLLLSTDLFPMAYDSDSCSRSYMYVYQLASEKRYPWNEIEIINITI